MNALTVCQPYAHLIVRGDKRVENRKWRTRYRGPLAIHAGKSRDWLDLDENDFDGSGIHLTEMAFGAVVGMVEVIDCLSIADIRAGRHDLKYPWIKNHLHTEGPYCIVLAHPLRFKTPPIPATGSLQIWSWGVDRGRLAHEIEACRPGNDRYWKAWLEKSSVGK